MDFDCYLGIDQSLTGTGIAMLDKEGQKIAIRLIAPPKKGPRARGVQRLDWITSIILEFIDEHSQGNVATVREGYSYASRGRSVFDLGELGGCIDLTLFHSAKDAGNMQHFIISPSTMKKWVLGSGNVKKDTAYLMKVMEKTNIQFPDDNQADAYMHAITLRAALMLVNEELDIEDLTEIQRSSFFSTKRLKSEKLTKAKLKKLSNEEFRALLSKVVTDDYRCF